MARPLLGHRKKGEHLHRIVRSGTRGARASLLLACALGAGVGQERPLSLEGIVSSGFYTTSSRDVTEVRVSIVPLSLNLDANGFLGDPGFLSFRIQPMLTTGPQATEAGFLGGNGVKVDTTLLGGRGFPVKLRYSNVRREDVFFGSLNQVSGFRSMNHETNLGLNWQLRARKLPQLNLDIGKSGLTADPNVSPIPNYDASNKRYALDVHDQRRGWEIDADLRRTGLRSTFASLSTAGFVSTRLDQNTDHAGVIARRPLWRGARVTFSGGATDNRNYFDSHPYSQNLRYAEGALDGGQGSRWQWRLRAGFNGNILGAGMSELVNPALSPDARTEGNLFAVQVGAFADRERAERLRSQMEKRHGTARVVEKPGEPALSRVLVGSETSSAQAGQLAATLRRETGTAMVVPLELSSAAGPAATAMPEVLLFAPYWNRFSNITLGGESRLQVTRDWSLLGSVQRERVIPQQSFLGAAASDYLYGTGGIGFQHRFSWANFGGQAGVSLGRMVYAGIPNRFLGRNYSFNAQRGTVDGLELSASFNNSTQRAKQLTTLDSGSSGGELGVGRRVGAFIFRGGAGLNQSSFRDPTLNYRSKGLSFRSEVQYRAVQASYSRNRSAGNTLSVYFVTPSTSSPSGSVLLGVPLRAILYSNVGDTLIFRASPFRRFETSVIWTRGHQRFDSQTVNDYDQLEMRATFRFRLLAFELGYVRYEQSLLTLSNYLRSRFYFRISRSFGILK